ncbi:MAG: protein kinase [Chloroflexi bacterium]|nr:protein kinase [Chloroflexota bacterium]
MMDDPLIGSQLANFRIERLIGRGGMAQVYYGWDVKLERPVAVKVIDARYRDNPTYAERFVREARAVATWHHENIIQIYYADDEDGLYYFVMECIEGLNLGELLSQHIAEGGLMPHAEVLRIGRTIASALDYAHEKGVIHRDVKPANAIMASDGRVVLTDFGLAMDVEQGSLGEVFGSSHYVAPEQARHSADAVPQSDLYSLGIILYEMLTGTVPFDDPSPTAVALQHVTMPPPPPREVNPGLGKEIEAVLLTALSKSPDERYQTGAELIDALQEALQIEPADISAFAQVEVEPVELPPMPAGVQPPSSKIGDSLIGQQFDEYRLDALLGQGGMARVYRGLDVRLKRWAAIKVIDAPFRADSDYAARFEREAQAVAQLEHPHIVRLYRYGEANDLLYMAMQYVEGIDLGALLAVYRADEERIEPEDAARIVREVCLALDYAHSKGVIHRDIKPSNIMLDAQGRAILADFGLALLTEVGTQGEILGSPRYVAPEQVISSANVVPQSDLYAVGIILYQMFTGQSPFDAADPLDVAMLHLTEPPRPPRELCPDVSPELEAVILKTLAKEPADRYQSGAELADALDQALQIQPSEPPVPAPTTDAVNLSISDRVALSLKAHPLPPIPAAVATPALKRTKSEPAKPERVKSKPEPVPAQVTVKALPASASASLRERLPIFISGAGIGITIVACVLVILLTVVVVWLISRNQDDLGLDQSLSLATPSATETTVPVILTSTPTIPPVVHAVDPSEGTLAPTVPAFTIEPTFTIAPTPTAPPPTLTPTTASPTEYDLLVVKQGDDGIFLFNRGAEPFPLVWLQLGDGDKVIYGLEWGIEALPNGACVVAWKDDKDIQIPDGLTCEVVGEQLTRDGPKRFWKEAFDIYYAGETIDTCAKDSPGGTFTIPIQTSERLLLIARRNEDGLFVVNYMASDFELQPLRLGEGENKMASGDEWGIATLERGSCVTVWKDDHEPRAPDGLTCNRVGELLSRRGDKQFWKSAYNVYYNDELVGTCENEQERCIINLSNNDP